MTFLFFWWHSFCIDFLYLCGLDVKGMGILIIITYNYYVFQDLCVCLFMYLLWWMIIVLHITRSKLHIQHLYLLNRVALALEFGFYFMLLFLSTNFWIYLQNQPLLYKYYKRKRGWVCSCFEFTEDFLFFITNHLHSVNNGLWFNS